MPTFKTLRLGADIVGLFWVNAFPELLVPLITGQIDLFVTVTKEQVREALVNPRASRAVGVRTRLNTIAVCAPQTISHTCGRNREWKMQPGKLRWPCVRRHRRHHLRPPRRRWEWRTGRYRGWREGGREVIEEWTCLLGGQGCGHWSDHTHIYTLKHTHTHRDTSNKASPGSSSHYCSVAVRIDLRAFAPEAT